MKDYLEKRREELSKREEGFTLMEMLIVVAIIAVLVAIAIPIFTSQLEKSREATDIANVRSAYAEVMTKYLTDGNSEQSAKVTAEQQQAGWQGESGYVNVRVEGSETRVSYKAVTKGGQYTIKFDGKKVTIS